MATIKLRGVGGGKMKKMRVSRSWLIRVVIRQQEQLNKLIELNLGAQRLVDELQARLDKETVTFEVKPLPEAKGLAPGGIPVQEFKSDL